MLAEDIPGSADSIEILLAGIDHLRASGRSSLGFGDSLMELLNKVLPVLQYAAVQGVVVRRKLDCLSALVKT